MSGYILSLEAVGQADLQRCGGKAAGLGELIRLGVRVPRGFCIVGDALSNVIAANGLREQIADLAASLNFDDYNAVEQKTGAIRSLITSAKLPGDLEREVSDRYSGLVTDDNQGGHNRYVAVRSSVAVKHSDISSFPGMMDTYHYVLGEHQVLEKIAECWASLWTVRGAYARHQRQLAHEDGVIAPIVQLMVDSEVAGVLFTANPITKNTGEIVIESNWGLGESVVSGKSMNDFFVLDKETFAVRQRRIPKKTLMVTMNDRGPGRAERPVPPDRSQESTLSDTQLAELGNVGKDIEDHFGFNVDVEWAFQDGKLHILQARKIRGLGEVARAGKKEA